MMPQELAHFAADLLLSLHPELVVVAGSLPNRVEGTGGVVVTVGVGGSWGNSPLHARMLHPVLRFNVWADVSRDDGLPTADDAEDRAWAVWELVDTVFHDIDHRNLSTVPGRKEGPIANCYRRFEPEVGEIPGGDGAVLLTAQYEVTV